TRARANRALAGVAGVARDRAGSDQRALARVAIRDLAVHRQRERTGIERVVEVAVDDDVVRAGGEVVEVDGRWRVAALERGAGAAGVVAREDAIPRRGQRQRERRERGYVDAIGEVVRRAARRAARGIDVAVRVGRVAHRRRAGDLDDAVGRHA